jgi:TldD protein
MPSISTEVIDFFSTICDLKSVETTAMTAFGSGDLGELFVEYKAEEIFRLENGIVQTPNFRIKRGFGLRTFNDDAIRYAHSSSLDTSTVKKVIENNLGTIVDCEISDWNCETNACYDNARFIDKFSSDAKINFLKEIDDYARAKSPHVKQVIAVLAGSWQVVNILTNAGKRVCDIRPLVKLSVSLVLEKNKIIESGSYAGGGRIGYDAVLNESTKIRYVDEALNQAYAKLQAIKAPVGEMPVVLGNGWTGILLHEAIGHGLEGDFIRKKTSSFCSLLGEMIASPAVTVVDDGTIFQHRGSVNVDDEGTPSQCTTLIQNGRLVGFMQDRRNANLMKVQATGNGRRESYENVPIPRMTNTFMLAGNNSQAEMVSSIDHGIFAKSFSDGQVDVTSGKFVFSASEAYLIENGKITAPVKGAMLIGDGPSILKQISMIGDDLSLDTGVGTCGKDNQMVPVGVGQPSVLINKITVGGTNL